MIYKRTILAFLYILVSSLAMAADLAVPIRFPGYGGVNTTSEPFDLDIAESPYILNMDHAGGVLQKRLGIERYGFRHWTIHTSDTSQFDILSATGHIDDFRGHKNLVTITNHPDYAGLGQIVVSDSFSTVCTTVINSPAIPIDSGTHDWTNYRNMSIHCDGFTIPLVFTTQDGGKYVDSLPDTLIWSPRTISLGMEAPGQPRAGRTRTGVLYGSYEYALCTKDSGNHSFVGVPSAQVFCNGNNVVITNFESSLPTDTILLVRRSVVGDRRWVKVDSIFFDPQLVEVYMPPLGWVGQYVCDSSYLSIVLDSAGLGTNVDSVQIVLLKVYNDAPTMRDSINAHTTINNRVRAYGMSWSYFTPGLLYVERTDTAWDMRVHVNNGGACSSLVVRTLSINIPANFAYVDSIATRTNFLVADSLDSALVIPGQMWIADSTGRGITDTSGQDTASGSSYAYIDSVYPVRFAYEDQTTGIESPWSPLLNTPFVTVVADSIYSVRLGLPRSYSHRPGWAIIYQGVKKTLLVGAGDTLIWYAVARIRLNRPTADTSQIFFHVGNWGDMAVATGLTVPDLYRDTTVDTTWWRYGVPFRSNPTNADSITYDSAQVYHDVNLVKNQNGDPVIRPSRLDPVIYDLQIPFSDMAVAGSRLWGIGHPQHPSRVYYSNYQEVSQWDAESWFIEIEPNSADELVAIEPAERGTGALLYAFKQNLLVAIVGTDPTRQHLWQPLSEKGAVSKDLVVNHRTYDGQSAIYYVSSDLKVYRLMNAGAPVDISYRFEADILSLLKNRHTATNWGRIIAMNNAIKIINDSTGQFVSMDLRNGGWSWQSYVPGLLPGGSLRYDTSQTPGVGELSFLFWDGAGPFYHEYVDTPRIDYWDSAGQSVPYAFPWAYETPSQGQGEWLWDIAQFRLSVNTMNSWARINYQVRDEEGTVLSEDSTDLNSGSKRSIPVPLGYNISVYPSLRLFGNANPNKTAAGVTSQLKISDLTLYLNHKGKNVPIGVDRRAFDDSTVYVGQQ